MIVLVLDVIAEVSADGICRTNSIKTWGEWMLPYVVGRFGIENSCDLISLAPWAVAVLVALSLRGLVDALSGVNPFEVVFGDRPIDGF